jgi:hypothetical protein
MAGLDSVTTLSPLILGNLNTHTHTHTHTHTAVTSYHGRLRLCDYTLATNTGQPKHTHTLQVHHVIISLTKRHIFITGLAVKFGLSFPGRAQQEQEQTHLGWGGGVRGPGSVRFYVADKLSVETVALISQGDQ